MRYKLQRDHRVLDLDKMVFVDSNEFWYQELSTGDIWSLCQIITHVEETILSMISAELRRINFLSPMDMRRLTLEDLEGNGNDHRLDNLKEFMRMLVAAARLWEN